MSNKRREKVERRQRRKEKGSQRRSKSGSRDRSSRWAEPGLDLDALVAPERLAEHIACFAAVVTQFEELDEFGFGDEELCDAILAPPGGEPAGAAPPEACALARAVIPRLARPGLAETLAEQLWSTREDVLPALEEECEEVEEEARAAFIAAGVLADRCVAAGAPSEHPFWELVFAATFGRAVDSGLLLVRIVENRLDSTPEEVTARIAARLERSAPEMAPAERERIVSAWVGLLDDVPDSPLPLDAALHLFRLHALLRDVGCNRLLARGAVPEVLDQIERAALDAYLRDVTPDVIDDLVTQCDRILAEEMQLEDEVRAGYEAERRLLRVLPREENVLLRRYHVRSVLDVEPVAEDDETLVGALNEDPEDPEALDALAESLRGEEGGSARIQRVERYRAHLGSDPGWFATGGEDLLEQGTALFESGRFAAALAPLEEAARADEDGEASFLFGATLERLGRWEEADAALIRAAELDPEAYVRPCRISDAELDRIVEETLASLPEPVRSAVREQCIVVREDFPLAARVRREGADPLLLGECVGTAEATRSRETGPTEILIYRRNLEKECGDREELAEQVRVTLFHEIGHALGLDEDGVDALGLA